MAGQGILEAIQVPPNRIGIIQALLRTYVSVDELFQHRQGDGWTTQGERHYFRYFRVRLRQKGNGPALACAAPGIPLPLSFYVSYDRSEHDFQALAIKISARAEHEDDWGSWIVTVEYSTEMPEGGPANSPQDPELEPPFLRWGYEVHQEAPQNDMQGKPFQNSAGMPYSPPPTFDLAYPTLTITRNEKDFSVDRTEYFSYSLNNRPFLGVPRGCVQSLPPEGEQKFRGPTQYWRTTYKLRFRRKGIFGNYRLPVIYVPGGGDAPATQSGVIIEGEIDEWQPRLLDQGLMQLVPEKDPVKAKKNPVVLVYCIGADGRRVSSPVMLNGAGGQAKRRYKQGFGLIPSYATYQVYPYVDLGILNERGMPIAPIIYPTPPIVFP